MSWLNYSGHSAADFPMDIRGGGSISPYLLQRHDPYAEIFKTLAPAIKDYLQQQKSDQIANELMNMENPPRAQAVDPSIQGAPATAPAHGGQQAYKAQKLYQDYISKQQSDQSQSTNDYWTNKVKETQANKYQADANAPDDRVEITLPDGRTARVTANEAAQYLKPRSSTAKADPWEGAMPIARGKISTDSKEGKVGDFTNQYSGAENGDMVKLATPTGYTVVVPWSSYQARSQRRNAGADIYQSRVQGEQPMPAPDLPPVTAPEPTTAPPLPTTAIIEKGGHHYEVDHASKKVLRQLD